MGIFVLILLQSLPPHATRQDAVPNPQRGPQYHARLLLPGDTDMQPCLPVPRQIVKKYMFRKPPPLILLHSTECDYNALHPRGLRLQAVKTLHS